MLTVGPLTLDRVGDVVHRVLEQQRRVADRHPLINGIVDSAILAEQLSSPAADVRIALRGDEVVGHLRGTTLDSSSFGRSVWISPEGVSFDNEEVLEHLYVAQCDRWLADGADRQYVWTPLDDGVVAWLHLGFSFMHQRGAMVVASAPPRPLPVGYTIRRGDIDDLATALSLDDHLHDAQEAGPSYALGLDTSTQRDEWIETLEDPDVTYVVVEHEGVAVAQCATFEVPERLGSFPRSIHLSAVTVHEDHRNRGIAGAMVDDVLGRARESGATYAETNWRVTTRRAARYWISYGFKPTYVRLHRHVGVG